MNSQFNSVIASLKQEQEVSTDLIFNMQKLKETLEGAVAQFQNEIRGNIEQLNTKMANLDKDITSLSVGYQKILSLKNDIHYVNQLAKNVEREVKQDRENFKNQIILLDLDHKNVNDRLTKTITKIKQDVGDIKKKIISSNSTV